MYAIVGFVIVLISYFTLPFRFMKQTYRELSAIGERGSVNVDEHEEIPLLSWVLVLGRSFISISAILLYLFAILAGAASDDGGALFVAIIFGPFFVIAFIWFWGVILEFVSLQILTARNTRLTYEAIKGGGDSPATGTTLPSPAPSAGSSIGSRVPSPAEQEQAE